MFKKLFISLIILSALTADGTAVFPAAYYDMLIFADCQSDILGEPDEGPVLISAGDAHDIKSYEISGYSWVSSGINIKYSAGLNIKEPLFKKKLFFGTDKYSLKDNLTEKVICSDIINIRWDYSNNDLVLNYTDSSPPFNYTM
ncbi:MAG TPA: hypothetical protein VIO64_13070 [Pseudobacteroides sp.]|uniref:hypothetical protein n=1 Tax=Pseudobacteroides sp. TaxID=1968840 RepID=UPI002F92304D